MQDGAVSYRAFLKMRQVDMAMFGCVTSEAEEEWSFVVFNALQGVLGPADGFMGLGGVQMKEKVGGLAGMAVDVEILKTFKKDSNEEVYRVEAIFALWTQLAA